SGGRQWLRADVEYCLAFTGKRGPIPWADNKAMGHPPKYPPGGKLSYRDASGRRRHLILGTSGHADGDAVYHKTLDRAVTEIANPGNLIHTSNGGGNIGDEEAHDNE